MISQRDRQRAADAQFEAGRTCKPITDTCPRPSWAIRPWASAVMGHPAMGIVWLANRLARHDIMLEPGHILLAGSFTRPVNVAAGDVIHADFGPLKSIGVSFS
jgi:hypothetical protein